jgi:protein-arginine kinase activator protein McsA
MKCDRCHQEAEILVIVPGPEPTPDSEYVCRECKRAGQKLRNAVRNFVYSQKIMNDIFRGMA